MKFSHIKVFNQRGETIVEALAAILIAALSCTILMTSVTAASMISKNSRTAEALYQAELKSAEIGDGTFDGTASETVSIEVIEGGHTVETYSYKVSYTGGEKKLTSYQLNESTAGLPEGTGE